MNNPMHRPMNRLVNRLVTKAVQAALLLAVALLLGGCSLLAGHGHDASSYGGDSLSPTMGKRNDIHLELIRGMLDKGQYYAALAHIQDEQRTLGKHNVRLRLLKADALRQLGRDAKARTLYLSLKGTAMRGQAEHGLGLLYAKQGNLKAAIKSLHEAAADLPTNVDIRNDLGYALLQAGLYSQAMPQLSTAAELAPDQLRSRKNLIILMYLMGNPRAARKLAHRSGLDARSLATLRQNARSIALQQIQRSRKPATSDAAG